ncbi:hypothetical protein GW17_00053074, partial [Ensete ventricosum]
DGGWLATRLNGCDAVKEPRNFEKVHPQRPALTQEAHPLVASISHPCSFCPVLVLPPSRKQASKQARRRKRRRLQKMLGPSGGALPLASLNHISIVCRTVERSLDFYHNVLGFLPVRRPVSFDFDGAWLFNYGIGIHLLQSEDPENMPAKREINPKDNHISFQVIESPSLCFFYLHVLGDQAHSVS